MKFVKVSLFAALMMVPAAAQAITVSVVSGGIAPTATYDAVGSPSNAIQSGAFHPGFLAWMNSIIEPDVATPDDVAWTKIDDTTGATGSTITNGGLSVTLLDDGSDPKSFSWTSDTAVEFVIYKGGTDPTFVAHYYAGGIFGNELTSTQGLSNLTVIDTDMSAVPIPAGGLLLLSALGGGLVLRSRRKTA